MSLFDGVQNFTPAFTGRQLAIEAGSKAGQNFTSGFSAGSQAKAHNQQFELGKDRLKLDKDRMKLEEKALEQRAFENQRSYQLQRDRYDEFKRQGDNIQSYNDTLRKYFEGQSGGQEKPQTPGPWSNGYVFQ